MAALFLNTFSALSQPPCFFRRDIFARNNQKAAALFAPQLLLLGIKMPFRSYVADTVPPILNFHGGKPPLQRLHSMGNDKTCRSRLPAPFEHSRSRLKALFFRGSKITGEHTSAALSCSKAFPVLQNSAKALPKLPRHSALCPWNALSHGRSHW